MAPNVLDDLCVADIMRRWPATIRVFMDSGMKCVGCPIAPFHTLADAALEHGLSLAGLDGRVNQCCAAEEPRADPSAGRRQ